MGYTVHVGGRSALELQGLAHYLPLGDIQRIGLYSTGKIPGWTRIFSDSFTFEIHNKQLFEELPKPGLSTRPFGSWDWPIPYSTPELALLELLADVRETADFSIADTFFEGAVNLRPKPLGELLTRCKQVKAKRLFLWFSDRHDHSWRKELETKGIDLSRGFTVAQVAESGIWPRRRPEKIMKRQPAISWNRARNTPSGSWSGL